MELSATNICAKFQANAFIFDCAMPKKPGNDNDVTILKPDFWNSVLSYKTNDIFGILRQNWTK